MRSTSPPWSYWDMVATCAARGGAVLDLGTGGGEQLARHRPEAPLVVATESWPPNVPLAAERLRPLGIPVVHAEGAPDNLDQAPDEPRGRLPFRDGAFGLVVDRHEAFNAREVARVLRPGGTFLTQQVMGGYDDLHDHLGLPRPQRQRFTLAEAARQVRAAGLVVEASGEAAAVQSFADVGALGWYLRQVPWAVPGFEVGRDRDRLRAVHDRIAAAGPIAIARHQFWLRARR